MTTSSDSLPLGNFILLSISLYLPWASDDDGNANEGTGKTKSSADNGEAKSSASSLYDNPNLLDKSSKTN